MIVIQVPPKIDPDEGFTLLIVGAGVIYVNALVLVAVPPGVVTATLCAPAVPAGVTAVMEFAFTTATLVAATPLTLTLVAPVKLVPVRVTVVRPAVLPVAGLTPVSVGTAAGAIGVTELDPADGALLPITLVAVTVKV